MTRSEIEAIILPRYINSLQSYVVKIKLKGGFMAYGEFQKIHQTDDNKIANKWTFTCAGLNMPIDGNDLISIDPVIKHEKPTN